MFGSQSLAGDNILSMSLLYKKLTPVFTKETYNHIVITLLKYLSYFYHNITTEFSF